MKSNFDIIWLDSVDSTNDEAQRRISDLDNLSVLSALSQTKGRGQGDHIWLSEPGSNLLFSIVLKYASAGSAQSPLLSVQAHDQIVISQITALSVVDLLAAHDIDAKIKLPNDIYVGDKKIFGILIEHSVCGKWLTSSIIGIGLNVNQRNFDVNLPNPISMMLLSKDSEENFDLKELLDEFMDIFTGYVDRFCHITGGYNRLERLFRAQLIVAQ
jgi:BirA family biotin operon repressor/biotin-[acetyl-CoA-carboxylase] ligase